MIFLACCTKVGVIFECLARSQKGKSALSKSIPIRQTNVPEVIGKLKCFKSWKRIIHFGSCLHVKNATFFGTVESALRLMLYFCQSAKMSDDWKCVKIIRRKVPMNKDNELIPFGHSNQRTSKGILLLLLVYGETDLDPFYISLLFKCHS